MHSINHIVLALEEPVEVEKNPCQPSPCGPNSQCREINGSPSCSCLEGFVGSPPLCKPECISNSECPNNLACIRQKCKDPCKGICGQNAECRVVTHTPNCVCLSGFTGDPFTNCVKEIIDQEIINPCSPSPCGANAVCSHRNKAGSCTCIKDYIGNPYEGCRPECSINSDCSSNQACVSGKCKDPCPGSCGQNAICQVINHLPQCTCFPGYSGDPFRFCSVIQRKIPLIKIFGQKLLFNYLLAIEEEETNPCQPNPCGPNSQCREVNGQAVCSCLPEYSGSPPSCRPECVVSSECPLNKACSQQKCIDPCPGVCGLNSNCQVIMHSPICSCKNGFTGDPFTRCYQIPRKKSDL